MRIAKRAVVEAVRLDRRQLHRGDCLHRPWLHLYLPEFGTVLATVQTGSCANGVAAEPWLADYRAVSPCVSTANENEPS